MKRRELLKGAGAAALASAISPARAADLPGVRWRLASSFPKSLDTLYGAVEMLAQRVGEITRGKFQIRPYAAGEIVPGLQVLDAVGQGTVECGQTPGYYYIGKNMAFAFDTALPFGLTARQQAGWMYYGGGLKLMREFMKDYHVIPFPGGSTGAQMGGWFRKEIKSLADLKGLKMRIPGLGGKIMEQMGVVPQTIPGSDVYPSLERGAIDATEWVGPYDDEKLGLHKIARHYYYPGWWEGGPQITLLVNDRKWAELPPEYQAAFEAAAGEAALHMLAEYDAKNPPALARLLAQGVKLHPFPKDVMETAHRIAFQMYEDEAKKNAAFKRIYVEWKKYREASIQWFKVAEASYANFLYYGPK